VPDFDGRMPLLEHLEELRRRLIRAVAAIAVGTVACWILYPQILDLLLQPYCQIRGSGSGSNAFGDGCELLVTDPLEPFGVRMMVAGYGGVALAMPVLLWQAWRFVVPGLHAGERRWAIPFVVVGVLLFASGCGLAYWSIPRALDFLIGIGGPDLVSIFSPSKYLGFVVKMMLAFGIGFEFPLEVGAATSTDLPASTAAIASSWKRSSWKERSRVTWCGPCDDADPAACPGGWPARRTPASVRTG